MRIEAKIIIRTTGKLFIFVLLTMLSIFTLLKSEGNRIKQNKYIEDENKKKNILLYGFIVILKEIEFTPILKNVPGF